MTDPLLDPLALPPFPSITPDAILPALDRAIAHHEAVVAQVVAERPTSFAGAWLPLERADAEIDALWSAVSHLHGVADTPELRAAYAEGEERIVANAIAVGQNRALYDVLVALTAAPAFGALDVADRVAVEHAIRDFRLSGVALDDEGRARFAEVSVELSALSTEFGSAVLDATDAWSEHVTDAGVLAGIGEADRAMFAAAAN
ncbi:MAG: oligopeptidase A, partial [Sphingomonas sp.]